MANRESLDQIALRAIAKLGDNAYGNSIMGEIAKTGRRASFGALYAVIERLARQGMIETWSEDGGPERGGRPKLMCRIKSGEWEQRRRGNGIDRS